MKSASYQYICIVAMVLTAFCLGGCEKEKEAGPWKKWEIKWVAGGKFTQATKVIGRFGRLQRNELWGPLPGYSFGGIDYLADEVLALKLETFKGTEDTRKDVLAMQRYAYFYKARSRGRKVGARKATEEELKQIKDDLKKAVELGYTNPDEIRNAEKELYQILEDAEILELLKDLDDKAEKRKLAGYSKEVTDGFELFTKAEKKSWKPDLKTAGGEAFWPDGSPTIVVLSRIHHDGLNKFIRRFEELAARKAPGMPLRLVFYQLKGDDKTRLEQTTDYVKFLGSTSPYSVIDRSQYLSLRETLKRRYEDGAAKAKKKNPVFDIFQPVIIFFDADGVPLYLTNGVLENEQIEFALAGFTSATGTGPK